MVEVRVPAAALEDEVAAGDQAPRLPLPALRALLDGVGGDALLWDPFQAVLDEVGCLFQVLFLVKTVLDESWRSFEHREDVNLGVLLELCAPLEKLKNILFNKLMLVITDLLLTGRPEDLLHLYYLDSF